MSFDSQVLEVHTLTLGYLKEEPKSFDEKGDDVRTCLGMKKGDVFRSPPLSPTLIFTPMSSDF